MVGKNFKIYIVQLTGKFILWIFFSLGMFWSLILHVEQSLYKFSPQNLILHEKHFFEKSPPPNSLWGKETPWKGLPNKTEIKRN